MNGLLEHVDLGRALLAIAVSIALFGVVQTERNPAESRVFDVPAELLDPPANVVVLSDERTVQVRVSASREAWATLRPTSVRAVVDLSGAAPGENEYPVRVETTDGRIRVVDTTPSRIAVAIDDKIDRAVPVRLSRLGTVPFGYQVGDAELDPTSVSVSGPASAVRRVEGALVEIRLDGVTVDIDGRYSAFLADAQGQPVSTEGRQLRLVPASVRVRIPVSQQLSVKTVGVQPNIVGTAPSGFLIEAVTTEPSAVTVVGAPRALATVSFVETERVDVSDATASFTRQVGIIVPEGMSAVQQDIVRVSVRITPIILSQSLTAVPSAEELLPGLQVTSPVPSVQIVLQAPGSALRGLAAADLRATMNLAGLGPGVHRVTVEVSPPPGITVQSVNPRVISVTLGETGTDSASVPPSERPGDTTAGPVGPTPSPTSPGRVPPAG